jgi:hypothetical protein
MSIVEQLQTRKSFLSSAELCEMLSLCRKTLTR